MVVTRTSGPASHTLRGRAGRPAPAGRRRGVATYWRQYLAIAPFYLVFLGFGLIPVIFTLFLAFQRWDGLGPMHFAGLQQFRDSYLAHVVLPFLPLMAARTGRTRRRRCCVAPPGRAAFRRRAGRVRIDRSG